MCVRAGKEIIDGVRALIAAEDELMGLVWHDWREASAYQLTAASDLGEARAALVRSGDPRAVAVLDRIIRGLLEQERPAGQRMGLLPVLEGVEG